MRENFIYDYFSLTDVDLQRWHNDFFWPVSRETTTRITLDLVSCFCDIANRLGNTFEGDCLIIGHLLSTYISRVINFSLVVQSLQKEGYAIRTSPRLTLVPRLIRGEPPNLRHVDIWRQSHESKLVRNAKDLALSLQYNVKKNSLNVADHFCTGRAVFAFHNQSVTERSYVMHHPDWIRLTSPEEWLDPALASSPSNASRKLFADVSRELVDKAVEYSRDSFDLDLRGVVADDLEQMVVQGLCHIAEAYSAVSSRAARLKPRQILSPTGGNPFTRAVNLAVRRNGGKATGHPHGYYSCHYSSPRQALHELATVDEFMAYTPGSVDLFHRNMAINPTPRNNSVTISHDNYDGHLKRWNSWKDKPLPDSIKTVMVVELVLLTEGGGYYAAESMVNYHFYYSLCKLLSDNGYKVIFKRRPKSLTWDNTNIFSGISNVEIEYRPFEAPGVIDQADAVIIQYAMSSTLYFSMCTNKTVIYADAGWEPWFPDVYELMTKRCRVLKCWYDERNRACFDENQLLDILETPPLQPNTDFLQKYLFPGTDATTQ